jgi:hypothetical protein
MKSVMDVLVGVVVEVWHITPTYLAQLAGKKWVMFWGSILVVFLVVKVGQFNRVTYS